MKRSDAIELLGAAIRMSTVRYVGDYGVEDVYDGIRDVLRHLMDHEPSLEDCRAVLGLTTSVR